MAKSNLVTESRLYACKHVSCIKVFYETVQGEHYAANALPNWAPASIRALSQLVTTGELYQI
eukprot:11118699-Karenia_brevis.AAC.1